MRSVSIVAALANRDRRARRSVYCLDRRDEHSAEEHHPSTPMRDTARHLFGEQRSDVRRERLANSSCDVTPKWQLFTGKRAISAGIRIRIDRALRYSVEGRRWTIRQCFHRCLYMQR